MRAAVVVGVALAIALLAGLAPSGPANAQAAPRPDLAVTRFVLVGPVPAWTNGTPASTTVQVTVANLGSAPASYRIDYLWVDSNGTRPLNEDESASTDAGGPLAPQASVTPPPVQWRLQPGQAGHGFVKALVHVAADQTQSAIDADSSNDARSIPLLVPIHQVQFDMTPTAAQAPADGVGFFRVTARNEGNVLEQVAVRLVHPPQDSRLHPTLDPQVFTIEPGSISNITLFVDYVPAGDFTPFTMRYDVEADPGFGAPIRLTTPELTGGPETGSLEGFSFVASAEPAKVLVPGNGEGLARLHLANQGTRPDAYRVDLTADPGWALSAGSSTGGTRVALYPGEQTVVPLHVRPPSASPPGSKTQIDVQVHASQLTTPALAAIKAEVPGAILAVAGLDVSTASVYTGDVPRVLATVANHGNQAAPAGSALSLAVTAPGMDPIQLRAVLDRLAPGQTALEAFDIPPFTTGGTAHLAVALQDPDGNLASQRAIDVMVHEAHLALQLPEPMTGGPGELVAYRVAPHAFHVINFGNSVEHVLVEAHAEAGSASIEGDSELDLAPAEVRTLAVLHTLPRPLAGRTEANLTVVVRIADRPEQSWRADVVTALVDQEAPRLGLASAPPLAWPLGTPLRLDVQAHDDDLIQSLWANATDSHGTNQTISLAASGADHWVGELLFLAAGNHTVTLTAADPAGNVANLTFTVEARPQLPPPRLALQGPGNEALGNGTAVEATQTLRLHVEDDAGVTQASLEIRQGTHAIQRNLTLQGGVASFDLHDAAPGPAEVRIEAIDAAGLASNLTLRVQVLSTPEPSGPTPAGASHPAPAFLAGTLVALVAAGLIWRRRPA